MSENHHADNASSRPWEDHEKLFVVYFSRIEGWKYTIITKHLWERSPSSISGIVKRMKATGEFDDLLSYSRTLSREDVERPILRVEDVFRPVEAQPLPDNGCCRWPIGSPDDASLGYCKFPRAPGLSYCPAHALLSVTTEFRSMMRQRINGGGGVPSPI